MKVLHFYKDYYPDEYGGVARFIRQLTKAGQAFGVKAEVLTLTPGTAGSILLDGVPVHRVKRLFKAASTDFAFRALTTFKRLAATADLVHYHFPWPLADIAHFWAGIDKPCLINYHADIVAQKKMLFLYRPLMNRFLQSVPAIVAASPNHINSSPVLKVHNDLVRCIPYGLDARPPLSSDAIERWRRRLPEKFFLFIGSFRYYKGLDFLLSAVKGQPFPLALAGGGHLEETMKARARTEGLNNVHFLGTLPDEDKEALLHLCYALVLPSHLRSEAFGIVLLEAARNGKPLVCCEIATGTTYVNIHDETGIVTPPADHGALRTALLTLWNDAALAARLGAGARRRFEELFTAEKMVRAYVDLYRELLGKEKL